MSHVIMSHVTCYMSQVTCHVSRYGMDGWLEDLAPLVVGRSSHGCGSYVSHGARVRAAC